MAQEPWFDPDALRTARLRAGLTQSQLARKIGAAGGDRVSAWERGVESPRMDALRKLARALKIDPAQLLRTGPRDLRWLRFSRGMSAKDLADKAHLTLPTLVRWEEEGLQRLPDPKSVAAVAAALKYPVATVEDAMTESRRRYLAEE